MRKKRLMIVAGEPSGDLQAAHLVKSIKSINPHIEIFGIGGKNMKEAGVEIVCDIVEFAVVGFVEVLKHIGAFRQIFHKLLALVEIKKPDAVILVDYPGFNLRLARSIKKKRNTTVIYYISPQVWAWGENRVVEIKKWVDKMIVIFGFEEQLYKQAGVKVNFVGHPFLDIVKPAWKKEEIIKHLHLKHNSIKIALFPGSRKKEVKRHLPCMLKACALVKKEMPDAEFILSCRKELGKSVYTKIIAASAINLHRLENRPYESMEIADLVVISSGSATLETAIIGKPMVIIYKTSFLTWLLARLMIKISDIGLVNVVAGKKVVPELIQFEVHPCNIARECLAILRDKKRQEEIKRELKAVKQKLGESGAAKRAAHIILKTIY